MDRYVLSYYRWLYRFFCL